MSETGTAVVIRGGTFLTADEGTGELENGALLVRDGRIAGISPDPSAYDGTADAEVVDASGAVVMPGIVDAHRHDWMALFRAATTNETLPDFLINTFYPLGSVFRADHMKAAVAVGTLGAINAGTTTVYEVNDCVNTPEHAEAALEAMRETGIRGVYGYGMQVYDFRPSGFADRAERLAFAESLAKKGTGTELIEMGMLLSDFGTVPFADTAAQIRKAHELGLKYASHTGAARTSVLLRGLRELDDHGLLFPEHLHAHSNGLTREDWRLIARSGGRVVSTPSSELQMGMGHLPRAACAEFGVTFALGTDLVGCTGDGLFSQAALALQTERMLAHDRIHAEDRMPFEPAVDRNEALRWMTMGGAEALGLADRIGSLTPGKDADLIILRHRNAFVPFTDAAGAALLLTEPSDVETVMIRGEFRKRNGRLLTNVATDRLRADALKAFEELRSSHAAHRRLNPQEVERFWKRAERQADVHFAQAYAEGVF